MSYFLVGLALIVVALCLQTVTLASGSYAGVLITALIVTAVADYSTLYELEPLPIPDGATVYRGFEVHYDEVEDYPVYDDPDIRSVPGFDSTGIHLDNVYRSKIGGYASNIQSEQWWSYTIDKDERQLVERCQPKFCFQIASEDKVRLYWGDNGILYFARSTAPADRPRWFLDTQCY